MSRDTMLRCRRQRERRRLGVTRVVEMRASGPIILAAAAVLLGTVFGQPPPSSIGAQGAGDVAPISLRTRIALPGVYGRIDHFGWDSKRGILLVSALGNNTVEIVDQW